MNSARLIHRNLLHFYTLITKYQKEKVKKQSHLKSHQTNKQTKKPRDLQSINLQQSRQEYTMEKTQSLQQVVLGKLGSHM